MSPQFDFAGGKARALFASLYGPEGLAGAPQRYIQIEEEFLHRFGPGPYRLFSAPGRAEIGGNHTDHNAGRVLAAAVSLDTVAAARANGTNTIRLISEGYAGESLVDLEDLLPAETERGTTDALIRGVASRMQSLGYRIGGFDAWVTSTVARGSGLSSSAAFEVLVAAMLDALFNSSEMDAKLRAQIAQYSENVFFGKPCGLMDQMASSAGGLIAIDFEDEALPKVEKVPFDFGGTGYRLVVTNTGGSHADLTNEYAAIPTDMRTVAEAFGCAKLREVDPEEFYRRIPGLRGMVSDRAILRAMHFFGENERVFRQARELAEGDLGAFFEDVVASGESSWKLLQNCFVGGSPEQGIALALALSGRTLRGRGAWRVHGGGFAGTVLAFVPAASLQEYLREMEGVFGAAACKVLSIRQKGAVEILF